MSVCLIQWHDGSVIDTVRPHKLEQSDLEFLRNSKWISGIFDKIVGISEIQRTLDLKLVSRNFAFNLRGYAVFAKHTVIPLYKYAVQWSFNHKIIIKYN